MLGSVVLAIFKWLKDPKNKQAIDDFTNFIENNLDKIFNGILALIGLRIGWNIFKWTRRLYKAFDFLKNKLPGGKPKPPKTPKAPTPSTPKVPSGPKIRPGGGVLGMAAGMVIESVLGDVIKKYVTDPLESKSLETKLKDYSELPTDEKRKERVTLIKERIKELEKHINSPLHAIEKGIALGGETQSEKKLRLNKALLESIQSYDKKIVSAKPQVQPQTSKVPGLPPSAAQPGTGPASNQVGSGSATFGETGNVSNAPGFVHGHFQTNTGTANDLVNDTAPIVKGLLDSGVIPELSKGQKFTPGMSMEEIKKLIRVGITQHGHSGDGRSVDIFVPKGTKVPFPLADVRNTGGRGGVTGILPGSGKVWVGHLAPTSKSGMVHAPVGETTMSAQVAQTPVATPSIPSPTGRGNIVPIPIPTGGGTPQASSGTAPNQAPVPRFSSEDPNNTTTMVVRAIYNIVG